MGVFLMKTNVSVSWCRGRYLPSKRFRLMFSNYYSRQRLWQLHSGGNGQYQGSNRHDICLMCDTEKDFFLLSGGKKSTDFNNLYLDKDKVSARLKMVTTFPMVYFLKDGKYVERRPYQRPTAESRKRMTTLTADKQYIDWGSFRQAEIQGRESNIDQYRNRYFIHQCHRIIL